MHGCGASHLGSGTIRIAMRRTQGVLPYRFTLMYVHVRAVERTIRISILMRGRAAIVASRRAKRPLFNPSDASTPRPRSAGWPAPAELTPPECPRAQGPRFVSGSAVPHDVACPACNACGHPIAATQKSRRSAQTPRRPVCGYCLPGRALSPPSGWPPAPTCAWHGWRVCSPTAPTPVSRPATSSAPARA